MLTIANLDGKDKVRYIISLPSAFLRYLGEMFFAYLAPVIGATGDWPKVVLVQLGILKSAAIRTGGGNFRLKKENIREFVMRIKGTHALGGDIGEGFGRYSRIHAERKTVVDIGAHKGDTAVYFALRKKAKRVIAFEPQESLCRIARRNVRKLHLQNRITIIEKGVAGDGLRGSSFSFGLTGKSSYVTLRSQVRRYRLRDAVLKIDCEGGEYEIIGGLREETADAFGQIAIRYYRGCSNLVGKLRSLGYRVDYARPDFSFANMFRDYLATGIVYAERRRGG